MGNRMGWIAIGCLALGACSKPVSESNSRDSFRVVTSDGSQPVGPASGARAAHAQEPGPNVALIGMQVDLLPEGNRLGDFNIWFEDYYAIEFRVERSKAGVEVQAGYQDTYAHDIVYFTLRPKGVFARVEFGSCLDGDFDVRDVGGCAWILTDGIQAVLEFELYATRERWYLQRYVGRVQLATKGVKLAQHLSSPTTIESRGGQKHRTCEYEGQVGWRDDLRDARFTSSGYVDALGRRQGIWTVKHGAVKLVETEWKDGVIDGLIMGYRPNSSLVSLSTYEKGLEHGVHTIWQEGGELQRTDPWIGGIETGESVSYHSNGWKQAHAFVIGSDMVVKAWDERGNLTSEETYSIADKNSFWAQFYSTDRSHLEEIEAMRLSRKF